jgi:hypothetical protein
VVVAATPMKIPIKIRIKISDPLISWINVANQDL